jgi:hypothetical protein
MSLGCKGLPPYVSDLYSQVGQGGFACRALSVIP